MTITIDCTDYNLPSEITLGDRIEYNNLYGKIIDIEEKQRVLNSVSFYGKIPAEILEQTNYDDVLVVYKELTRQFSENIDFSVPYDYQRDFFWKGDLWKIGAAELKQDSKMLFGEFIDAKQSVQNNGDDTWSSLLSLCCVYFRKKDEAYDKTFPIDGPRMELMKSLPFSYAIELGFFLSNS